MNPLLLFLACTEIKDSGEVPLEPMMTGTILPDTPAPSGDSVSGEFFGYHAFSFLVEDKFVTYISSNPNSTCSKVVDYLNINGDPYDPVDVLEPGGCNMYIEVEGFNNGSYSASNDIIASASSAIACAMGEGTFEMATFDADDTDYYWVADDGGPGAWWQGVPQMFSWEFSEADDGFLLDISMSSYTGAFIYEEFANNPASGTVSGTVQAEICEGLASTGVF
jgi:hypothetical protein